MPIKKAHEQYKRTLPRFRQHGCCTTGGLGPLRRLKPELITQCCCLDGPMSLCAVYRARRIRLYINIRDNSWSNEMYPLFHPDSIYPSETLPPTKR